MAKYGGGILGQRVVETDGVVKQLRVMHKRTRERTAWNVSFQTYYAEWVHEDMTAYHAPPTQAKFLEEPARAYSTQMADIVRGVLALGKSFRDATYSAARFLLHQAQKITPVATGALRRSGQVVDATMTLDDAPMSLSPDAGTAANPLSLD